MSIYFRGKVFETYAQKIFIGDRRVERVYVGHETYYPDMLVDNIVLAQWIEFPEKVTIYGERPVNRYGAMLIINKGARIDRCAVYLRFKDDGTLYARQFGFRGRFVTEAFYAPFLAYDEEIVYCGNISSPEDEFHDWDSSSSNKLCAYAMRVDHEALFPECYGMREKRTELYYTTKKEGQYGTYNEYHNLSELSTEYKCTQNVRMFKSSGAFDRYIHGDWQVLKADYG